MELPGGEKRAIDCLFWVRQQGKLMAKIAIPPQKYLPKDTIKLRDAVGRAVLEAKAQAQLPGVCEGPVLVSWLAVFALPKSAERVHKPPGRRWKVSRPDRDNVDKPILDALKGRIYGEDWQVVTGTTLKVVGAQGELPHIHLWLQDASEIPIPELGAAQPSLFQGIG